MYRMPWLFGAPPPTEELLGSVLRVRRPSPPAHARSDWGARSPTSEGPLARLPQAALFISKNRRPIVSESQGAGPSRCYGEGLGLHSGRSGAALPPLRPGRGLLIAILTPDHRAVEAVGVTAERVLHGRALAKHAQRHRAAAGSSREAPCSPRRPGRCARRTPPLR